MKIFKVLLNSRTHSLKNFAKKSSSYENNAKYFVFFNQIFENFENNTANLIFNDFEDSDVATLDFRIIIIMSVIEKENLNLNILYEKHFTILRAFFQHYLFGLINNIIKFLNSILLSNHFQFN